jgi:AcrR family transcriptional regulator
MDPAPIDPAPIRTRDRIVREAMRLFAEQGYDGTSVASIEAAAGLSKGSGGLYKHFESKRAVLVEGVTRLLATGSELRRMLDGPAPASPSPAAARASLPETLQRIAKAGLDRLEQERDFNRLLVRDLARFPELLDKAREEEIARNHRQLTAWLMTRAGEQPAADRDWAPIAAVLTGATAHYWLLRDIFGGDHPTGVSESAYLAAMADLVSALLRAG